MDRQSHLSSQAEIVCSLRKPGFLAYARAGSLRRIRRASSIAYLFIVTLVAMVVACQRTPVAPVGGVDAQQGLLVEASDGSEALTDLGLEPAKTDWPCWRNRAGGAKSFDTDPPTHWTKTEHVAWVTEIPGRGHSSPIVWGERIFLTSADESGHKQLVLGFDRASGKQLLSTVAHEGGFMRMHGKNSHASATPACDGQRVYSAFINSDALHVTATDFNGLILWQTQAGPFGSEHGYGSSLVLYKNLVIVAADNLSHSFIAALDGITGKIVWRMPRKTTARHGSYATPIVAFLAGRHQLIFSGLWETSSYDPATGKLIWYCKGPTEVTACTPAFSDELVYSSGGYPGRELLAIQADGSNDVTNTKIVWRADKGVTYVPSPLFHDGRLYVVDDGGIASCLDGSTGEVVWRARLPGNFSASPVLAAGLLFIPNEVGRTYVFRAGDKFELVATNDLGDGGFATPVIAGGHIYLRTNHYLYAIGEKSLPGGNR